MGLPGHQVTDVSIMVAFGIVVWLGWSLPFLGLSWWQEREQLRGAAPRQPNPGAAGPDRGPASLS